MRITPVLLTLLGFCAGIGSAVADPPHGTRHAKFKLPTAKAPRAAPQSAANDLQFVAIQQPTSGASDGEPGYLGVVLDDRFDGGAGLRVLEVVPGGPAEAAGLRVGDRLTEVEGRNVRTMPDFVEMIGRRTAGKVVELTVLRDRRPTRLKVTLGRRPDEGSRAFELFGPIPEPLAEGLVPRDVMLGVRMAPVTTALQTILGLRDSRGALVVEVVPGSPAHRAGIREEAVILAVDGKRIDVPDDVTRAILAAGPGQEVKLAYSYRGKLYERKIRLAVVGESGQPLAEGPDRIEQLEREIEQLRRRVDRLEQLVEHLTGQPAP